MVLSSKVKVKQGVINGVEDSLPNGDTYYYFLGIPYAEPPLGKLRFQAPVALERFSTPEIDCKKNGGISLQKDVRTGKTVGSEDCLFLNVYAPKGKADAILPVMVYIHGGGYVSGNGSNDFYNPLYLLQEGVIVVTMNYRLGVLGFLSLPEANIPGNAGLKDQRLALQWVQENIAQFNGDPKNVTLIGHSAGAACTHLHLLSEKSRKLFHKAIIQSGLGTMHWAIDVENSIKSKKLAHAMGCTSDDPFKIAEFLQNFEDLSGFLISIRTGSVLNEHFQGRSSPISPVIEKDSPEAVITKSPLDAMKDKNTIDIPVMMGYTSAEAIVILALLGDIVNGIDLREVNPKCINLKPEDPRKNDFTNSIRQLYFNGENVDKSKLSALNDLLGDISFIVDTQVAAEIHSICQHTSPLYFYRFDYDGALNLYKNKIFGFKDIPGASHADELFYLFQAAIAPEPWDLEAKKMVQTMCKLWTNFVKYNNPTPTRDGELVKCIWEPVGKIGDNDSFTLNAFIINAEQQMLENPNKERINLWKAMRKTYQ